MEYDSTYSGILLSSFNEMRKAEVMCDFTIKVDDKSFHVHRVVLAAASKYFTAMFSSKMKEVQLKFVDMKSLNVSGVRQCIQYMYTGGIEPKMESVQHTLEASTLIQLDGLTSICIKFLQNHLSVDAYLSTLNLSSLRGRDDVSKLAENYILANFEAVTLTEMFPLISKSDLLHYIEASKANHHVTWQAVMRWFSVAREESEKLVFDVVKSINLSDFPFQFLLKTVLNEPLLKDNDNCTKLVIDSLFKDIDSVKTNLSTENFFVVKNLTKSYAIPNSENIKEVVKKYLEEHFEDLAKKDGFNNVDKDEIISLFQSSNIKYSSEKTKWLAALKWAKYDQHHRKKTFVKLFELINLEHLSPDFIQQTVRNETLVKESHECKDMLLDVLYARGGKENKKDEQALVSHIICMDINNGVIKALNLMTNLWSDLPKISPSQNDGIWKQTQVVNVCNELYCLDFEKVSKFDLKEMKWIQKQSRRRQTEICFEVVAFQKHIYVISGNITTCYDVDDDSWEENLPGCGLDDQFCATSCEKFIYTVGGYKDGEITADAKRFDPVTRSFSQISRMKRARNQASAAVFHEMLFVVGGYAGSSVEIYNPLLNSWSDLKGSGVECSRFSLCVASNRLYVVGAQILTEDRGFFRTYRHTMQVYDEDANEWKIFTSNPEMEFYRTSCCAVDLRCEKNE